MSVRSEAAGAPAALARRAFVTAVLATLWTCGACTAGPNTIRLLDKHEADAGTPSCHVDADCSGDRPRCDPDEGRCVECFLASECAQGMSCSSTMHTCESHCATSEDCAGLDEKVCNVDGACVECASDSDCAGNSQTPRCNLQAGICVQCVLTTDCNPRTCFDDCLTCSANKCVWRF